MPRQHTSQPIERDLEQPRAQRVRAAAAADRDASLFWLGSVGTLVIVGLTLLFSTREAFADPAALVMADATGLAGVMGVSADQIVPDEAAAPVPLETLDSLLSIPRTTSMRTDAQIADETIAAAVERGSNPDLVKKSAFRKRNTDLFRTERPVAIGEQELLLRLRLRAKTRRAMSVEVRF